MRHVNKCKCIYEPKGDKGLEGYILNENYKYILTKDIRSIYYKVYPIDSNYFETCSPVAFKKYFKLITVIRRVK